MPPQSAPITVKAQQNNDKYNNGKVFVCSAIKATIKQREQNTIALISAPKITPRILSPILPAKTPKGDKNNEKHKAPKIAFVNGTLG